MYHIDDTYFEEANKCVQQHEGMYCFLKQKILHFDDFTNFKINRSFTICFRYKYY